MFGLLFLSSSLFVPPGVVGASKVKTGIGALPSPPPHISSALWILLLVHASKNVVVVGTVCNTVLVPVKLSVTVTCLEIFFVKSVSKDVILIPRK